MNDERAYGIAAPIAAKWPVSTSAMWIAMVRAGYLAALEDAAEACEKLEIGPDSTGERTTQARYFDAACGNCAAAVRALGE